MSLLSQTRTKEAATSPVPAKTRRPWRSAAKVAASLGLLAALFTLALPAVSGASLQSALAVLARLSLTEVLGLTALWVLGLVAYAVVLAAALPGLRVAQGFVLNLVGSGVSNLAPLGGAVGVGVTWTMLRQYGFGHPSILLFTLVTGVWNVVARLALPLFGIAALVLVGAPVSRSLLVTTGTSAALGVLVVGLVVTAFTSEAFWSKVRVVVAWSHGRFARLTGRTVDPDVADDLTARRTEAVHLLRAERLPLVGGMLAYLLLQGVLMWACLAAVGSHLGWAEVAAGYALGRMLTLVALTPGGTGFAETGAAAVLIALGGDPAVTLAGVLLFSFFTFVCEIPGGALAYGWHLLARKRWQVSSPADEPGDLGVRTSG
ncbi:MAG: lysylphosphatidylglycerol synthase domain-containing protein [Humibacillus sp.]|nr:lysylphosphatidylglycerol synthase domain-containing protein [Humibacillus sp.]MDN5776356.1 lysylphosphatidylglycerol synthase domain-containing protein [Humibacillus sp.]